jgi:hypothetical protein
MIEHPQNRPFGGAVAKDLDWTCGFAKASEANGGLSSISAALRFVFDPYGPSVLDFSGAAATSWRGLDADEPSSVKALFSR